MAKRRALVIGGSLGGLLAAHLLRGAGLEVVVFERNAEDLTGRGAGISTHPQLVDILRRVGIAFDESMGIKVDTVICLDRSGHTYLEDQDGADDELVGAALSLAAGSAAVRELSSRHVAAAGRAGRRRRHRACSPTARGSRETCWSAPTGCARRCASSSCPTSQPNYAGYVAWRAMLDESEVPPDIRAEIFERYTFCLPEGELFLAYPVPGRNNETQPGRRAYNIVWYRPADPDRALADLCTDASGRRHGTAIRAAADPARGDGRDQGDGARAGRAAGGGNLCAHGAAVLSADLRSRIAADRVRTGGAAGRRRLRGAAACRRWRDQGGARRRQPGGGRPAGRPARRPAALPAQAAAVRPSPGRARAGRKAPISAPSSSRASSAARPSLTGTSGTWCSPTIRAARICARRLAKLRSSSIRSCAAHARRPTTAQTQPPITEPPASSVRCPALSGCPVIVARHQILDQLVELAPIGLPDTNDCG